MKNLIIAAALCLCWTNIFAQLEASHWHLNNQQSIVFENGEPTLGGPSSMVTVEANASYADENGNLLFYTNGGPSPTPPGLGSGKIWNRNHEVMYDMGFDQGGGSSANTGAVIFPVPGQDNKYYLFVVGEAEENFRGLCYFIIDMDLNGGLGGVETYVESIFLNTIEAVSAIQAADCSGYWLMVLEKESERAVVFSVTTAGVSTGIPYNLSLSPEIRPSKIKFSPDGSMVAIERKIFSFDNETGVIDPTPILDLSPGANGGTGFFIFLVTGFSADSRYVFTDDYINESPDIAIEINRYDLLAPDILASKQTVYTVFPDNGTSITSISLTSLQLGPDGGLYFLFLELFNAGQVFFSNIGAIVDPSADVPVINIDVLSNSSPDPNNLVVSLPNFVESIFDTGRELPPITGQATACSGQTESFLITADDDGFEDYVWTQADSNTLTEIGQGLSVDASFLTPGTYEVCAQRRDNCRGVDSTCFEVIVEETINEIIELELCDGNVLTINDTVISTPGEYSFFEQNNEGCNSVTYLVSEPEVTINSLDLFTCEGDTLIVNGIPYFSTGNYEQAISRPDQCDSILQIQFTLVVCNLQASREITSTGCGEDATGVVSFRVTNGTPPFSYELTDLNGMELSTGNIAQVNETITETGLLPGTYQITINDAFGNDIRILNIVIVNPAPLAVTTIRSDYNGRPISCNGAADGRIELEISGGTFPYEVSWSDGPFSQIREDLSAANYTYTVTDASGCETSEVVMLTEPEPITAEVTTRPVSCEGSNTGMITISQVNGGTGTYQYQLNNAAFAIDSIFNDIAIGTYEVAVQDINSCSFAQTVEVGGVVVPTISLQEEYSIDLGEEITVPYLVTNAVSTEITPSPDFTVVTNADRSVTILPLRSDYLVVNAISVSGCVVADSTFLLVSAARGKRVYAPNAFSPNFDGINDEFQLYPGIAITSIEELRIFDRWGGMRFEQSGGIPRWDGGEVGNGTYVWTVRVTYIDGESEVLSGMITLLR